MRPVEDYVLDLIEREQKALRNIGSLRTGFYQFIVLLRAIGWRPGEISKMLKPHGRGYSQSNIDLIIQNSIAEMEF